MEQNTRFKQALVIQTCVGSLSDNIFRNIQINSLFTDPRIAKAKNKKVVFKIFFQLMSQSKRPPPKY